MNNKHDIETRLDHLAKNKAAPSSLTISVMRRVYTLPAHERKRWPRWFAVLLRPAYSFSAAIVLGVVFWIEVLSTTQTLYARTISAISKAESIYFSAGLVGRTNNIIIREIWFDRDHGAAEIMHAPFGEGGITQVDNLESHWVFRNKTKTLVRTQSKNTIEAVLWKISALAKVDLFPERATKTVTNDDEELRVYTHQDGPTLYEIYIDSQERPKLFYFYYKKDDGSWHQDEWMKFEYDLAIPEERFAPSDHPDSLIKEWDHEFDVTELIDNSFGTENALAIDETDGYTFVVHEAVPLDNGCFAVRTSLQNTYDLPEYKNDSFSFLEPPRMRANYHLGRWFSMLEDGSTVGYYFANKVVTLKHERMIMNWWIVYPPEEMRGHDQQYVVAQIQDAPRDKENKPIIRDKKQSFSLTSLTSFISGRFRYKRRSPVRATFPVTGESVAVNVFLKQVYEEAETYHNAFSSVSLSYAVIGNHNIHAGDKNSEDFDVWVRDDFVGIWMRTIPINAKKDLQIDTVSQVELDNHYDDVMELQARIKSRNAQVVRMRSQFPHKEKESEESTEPEQE